MKGFIPLLALFIACPALAIQSGISGHAAGDVIAVKTDSEIAAWCNFDKSVVVTSMNVLCVYNGSKQTPSS